MKFLLSALASLTVSLVSAQEYNTSAPFTLKLESSANISGTYLASCHAGAAIEQVCLDGTDVPANNYGTYYLNVSSSSGASENEGILVWNLPVGDTNVSSGLQFTPSLYSTLVAPLFEPSASYNTVGFDDDGKLYINSGPYDESTFVAGTYPTSVTPVPLYHWYACYTYSTGYYYNALAWDITGAPVNPTCVAVNVTREFL